MRAEIIAHLSCVRCKLILNSVTDMGAIISAPLMAIGEKLGLYKAMAHAGPLSSQEAAERSGAPERPV